VGRWRGSGTGAVASSGTTFAYTQQISFTHDGRPFLAYESRSWLVDDAGAVIRPAWRESGFWRPGATDDDLEVVLASNTGQAMAFVGVSGDLRWELASAAVTPVPSAKHVDGERRLYALVDEMLLYATELAPGGADYAPHLNARLSRSQLG
jgi:hypothetical protein